MGVEYQISYTGECLKSLDDSLRRYGGRSSIEQPRQYEFRFQSVLATEMPDAMVIIEEEGIYFVDNVGSREQVAILFRLIIDEAITKSGSLESVVVKRL